MDQVLGMLFGIDLGDALGWPAEPLTLEQIRARFGPQGIQELPEPALFTDDTQMTLAVAEALIDAGDQNLQGPMAAVTRRFVEWLHSPESYRAPGASFLIWRQSTEPRRALAGGRQPRLQRLRRGQAGGAHRVSLPARPTSPAGSGGGHGSVHPPAPGRRGRRGGRSLSGETGLGLSPSNRFYYFAEKGNPGVGG
jgi:hypothetical protein